MRTVLKLIVAFLLTVFIVLIAFAVGFGVNLYHAQTQPKTEIPQKFGLFWESWKIVQGEFYGDVPDKQTLTRGAIRGLLQSLGDPHTVLIEPAPAQVEQANLKGETGDVGLNLDVRNHVLTIVSPIPGSPADKAELRAGDLILKIGDKLLPFDITVQDAQNQLRGPIGSKVMLNVRRIGDPKPFDVELAREKYPLPTVDAKMLPGTTFGYIKVTMETAETGNEFAKALDSLKAQKMTGLVLDLRNNPGGLFPDPVLDITGQFLKNNDVVLYEWHRKRFSRWQSPRRDGRSARGPRQQRHGECGRNHRGRAERLQARCLDRRADVWQGFGASDSQLERRRGAAHHRRDVVHAQAYAARRQGAGAGHCDSAHRRFDQKETRSAIGSRDSIPAERRVTIFDFRLPIFDWSAKSKI